MAVLSSGELTEMRQNIARAIGSGVPWTKPVINAASQAVENWFETNRASLNTAINSATAPLVLTTQQKRILVAYCMRQKSGREA